MRAADVLFLSNEYLQNREADFVRQLAALYPCRIFVVGMGAEGALLPPQQFVRAAGGAGAVPDAQAAFQQQAYQLADPAGVCIGEGEVQIGLRSLIGRRLFPPVFHFPAPSRR